MHKNSRKFYVIWPSVK